MTAAESFVDAYAPHGPYVTLFACVHIDPCERNRRRRPRASASSEDVMSEHTGELVSVKIIPTRKGIRQESWRTPR